MISLHAVLRLHEPASVCVILPSIIYLILMPAILSPCVSNYNKINCIIALARIRCTIMCGAPDVLKVTPLL